MEELLDGCPPRDNSAVNRSRFDPSRPLETKYTTRYVVLVWIYLTAVRQGTTVPSTVLVQTRQRLFRPNISVVVCRVLRQPSRVPSTEPTSILGEGVVPT